MDTVTQAALGACIAQAGFSERLGRKALVIGTLCGLLPDFDFLLSLGSDHFTYLLTHRGWSHSLLVLPFIALLVAWLAQKWGARVNSRFSKDTLKQENSYFLWYWLCLLALITHPLLDLFTTFGTQIFAPFTNTRFTLNGVSIIDPIYTIPLLIAVGFGLLRKNPIKDRNLAVAALFISSAYLGFGLHNSTQAKSAAVEQLTKINFEPVDVRASPTMFNTLLWRIIAKDREGRFAVGFFSTVTKKTIDFTLYENEKNDFITQALNSHEGQILQWFSTKLLKANIRRTDEGNVQVILVDMRFGMVTNPIASFFTSVFEFNENKTLLNIDTSNSSSKPIEPAQELGSIWQMIWYE